MIWACGGIIVDIRLWKKQTSLKEKREKIQWKNVMRMWPHSFLKPCPVQCSYDFKEFILVSTGSTGRFGPVFKTSVWCWFKAT